ncbi:hypothetical protein [Pseudomonas sp. 9Ag]|uniref:hypothetical protein n=1 Tax=Pseudomonas sp. 9Ag TaxID=2653167 RepID=UPI00135A5B9E|nr:hypothetical protein [Pseudomonas sp. 9Ag]
MIRLIAVFLFLLSPLLSNIKVLPGFSWGDLAVLFFLVWFLTSRRSLSLNSWVALGVVAFFAFFVLIYKLIFFNVGYFPALRMLFYISCLAILLDGFRSEGLMRQIALLYMGLSVLFAVLLVLQVFLYKFFGVVFVYLETPYDIEVNSVRSLGVEAYGMRTGGVFKEPSYYVIYMFPALFYAANSKKIVLWSFFSVSIILSTSALGFLFVVVTFYSFFADRKSFLALALLLSSMVFVFCYSFGFFPSRVAETIAGGGSLAVRLFDPFLYLFRNLNDFVFPGLGRLDTQAVSWLNSLSYIFVLFGISGGLLLLLLLLLSGGVAWFALLLLFLTNSLTNPYFLVVMLLVKHFSRPVAFSSSVVRGCRKRNSLTRSPLKSPALSCGLSY